MADLQENQSVQEFYKLLAEQQPDKAQDLSALLFYVDGTERQFDAVFQELQAVKAQLAEVKDNQNPVKQALSGMVERLENKLEQMRERLFAIKDSIVETASKMVDSVKQTGISALDKTVSFFGVKDALNAVQTDLSDSIKDTKQHIEKIETIGQELRSVGTHMKNVGRAVAGADLKPVREAEGKFQAAVLAPMRTSHKLLVNLNNATLAAIGGVERLEQAAETGREKKAARQAEKPSVLQELQTLKAEAAARPAPAQEKQAKAQEAAL